MIECLRFKPINKGILLGYADLFVSEFGLEFYNCSLFEKNGQRWVAFPSKETEPDADGKRKFFPYIRFKNKDCSDAFSRAAIQAIAKKMDPIPTQMNLFE